MSWSDAATATAPTSLAEWPVVDVGPLPPEVIAEGAEVGLASGRFEVPLTLTANDDSAEYEIAVTAEPGWAAEVFDPYSWDSRVPIVSTSRAADGPTAVLILTRGADAVSTPTGLLRVKLEFRDREGMARDGAAVVHFADAGSVLVPISFDDYSIGMSDLAGDGDEIGVVDGSTAVARFSEPSVSAATAANFTPMATGGIGFIWGRVVFWDTRPRFGATGSRYEPCDSTRIPCVAGTPECCNSPVPHVRIILLGWGANGGWVHLGETGTDDAGGFVLATYDMGATKSIRVRVQFDQVYPGGPGDFQLGVGASGVHVVESVVGVVNPLAADLRTIQVNPEGDLTSLDGDVAAAWASIIDADGRLADEGETTQRDATTAFRILETPQAQDCTKEVAIEEFIQPGEARTPSPARALGRALMARLVGCDEISSWPEFPVLDMGTRAEFSGRLYDRDTAEGVALVAAIPELVALLTWWDPATATWSGMKTTHAYKCVGNSPTTGYCNIRGQWVVTGTTGLSNSNNLASYRNNAFALWNLIDASTADAFYCKTDAVDLTVRDLMVALLAFQAGPQDGSNGSANEMSLTDPQEPCAVTEDCPEGSVCGGVLFARCHSGDPHGTNLRDWLRYLPSGETAAAAAMTSHECVGIEDNAAPFRGGYRGD